MREKQTFAYYPKNYSGYPMVKINLVKGKILTECVDNACGGKLKWGIAIGDDSEYAKCQKCKIGYWDGRYLC